jgi:hypothetical protein
MKRDSDILGLSDVTPERNLEQTDNSSFTSSSSSERDRRRRRMSEGADELTPEASTPSRTPGATGIDMGSGGEGTDIE